MVKGVNRQVLEVHDFDDSYFEKALFFVRPECATLSENKLRDKLSAYLHSDTQIPKTRKQRCLHGVFTALELLGAAAAGAVLTAVCM